MSEIPLAVKVGAATGIGGLLVGTLIGENRANTQDVGELQATSSISLENPPYHQPPEFIFPPIICNPLEIVSQQQDSIANPDINPTLSLYLEANSNYENLNSRIMGSDGQVFLEGNPQGSLELKRKSIDHVVNGICLAQNTEGLKDKFSYNGTTARYDGKEFNLNTPIEFQIFAAILKEEISSAARLNSLDNAERNINDLLKIPDLPGDVLIEPDAFPLISPEHLILYSRMQQLMISEGLPPVGIVYFKGFRKGDIGGAWYQGSTPDSKSTITVTNHSTPSDTIPHEFGHHVAESLDRLGNQGGLVGFASKYTDLRKSLGMSNEFETTHETDGSFTINPQEEYAEAFRRFVGAGSSIALPGSEGEILAFEQAFFENIFKQDYFVNGLPLERVKSEELELGKKYRGLGKANIKTLQFYEEHPGFFGEQILSGEIDYNLEKGPKLFTTPDGNSVETWYVTVTDPYSETIIPIGWLTGEEFAILK